MRNPNSPSPPRLTTDPIPLPAIYAQGVLTGAVVVYDLDRVDEWPFQQERLLAPFTLADLPLGPERGARIRQQYTTVLGFCCCGIQTPAGAPLFGEIDAPDSFAALPRPLLRWLGGPGIAAAQGLIDASFQPAEPTPPAAEATPT